MNRIISRKTTFGILFFLFIAGFANIAKADDGSKQRTITVSGEGKVRAVPDQAEMQFTVQEDGAKLKDVSAQVQTKMKSVFQVLKSYGITDKDSQTVSYNIQPKYKYDKSGNAAKIGYTVSNRVKVVLKDLDKAGDLLEAVTDAEVSEVDGPNFSFSDPAKLQIEAMKAAVADAQAKAEALAEASGAGLDKVFSITQTSASVPILGNALRSNLALAGNNGVPIAAGQNEVTAQVEVVYSLK